MSQELRVVDDKVEKFRLTFEKFVTIEILILFFLFLKKNFLFRSNRKTNEAQRLKVELEKANETIEAAQNLVGKLEGEFHR